MPKKSKTTRAMPVADLSEAELREKLNDWARSKPTIVEAAEYDALLDKTILKRARRADKLVAELERTLSGIAERSTRRDAAALNVAVQKIRDAVGALKWGPHYADTGWRVHPVLWEPAPDEQPTKKASRKRKKPPQK